LHLFLHEEEIIYNYECDTVEYYRELYDWEEIRDKAIAVFKSNKSKMMYMTAYTVSKDLHLES
jgi:hypothetical protein